MLTHYPQGKGVHKVKSLGSRVTQRKDPKQLMHIGQQFTMLRQMRNMSREKLSREATKLDGRKISTGAIANIERGLPGSFRILNACLRVLGGTINIMPLAMPSYVNPQMQGVQLTIKHIRPNAKNSMLEEEETEDHHG